MEKAGANRSMKGVDVPMTPASASMKCVSPAFKGVSLSLQASNGTLQRANGVPRTVKPDVEAITRIHQAVNPQLQAVTPVVQHNSSMVQRRAQANCRARLSDISLPPRSILEMMPCVALMSKASCSCESPRAVRRARTFAPSSIGHGVIVGAAVPLECPLLEHALPVHRA